MGAYEQLRENLPVCCERTYLRSYTFRQSNWFKRMFNIRGTGKYHATVECMFCHSFISLIFDDSVWVQVAQVQTVPIEKGGRLWR